MIVRGPRRQTNFTVLPNEALRDVRLSFKARGLLAYILSMPDHWATSSEALARQGPDGRDSVRSGLRELRALGYVVLEKRQQAGGRWITDVIVHESPVDTLGTALPPRPEKPTPENPAVIQELTSKDCDQVLRHVQVESYTICGNCWGSRYSPDTMTICTQCLGQGTIKRVGL
jgi:hypothetical protein